MNLLKSRFRRTTAVVAGAFIGLIGAFALIAPASAHNGNLTATSECTDTGWKTTWSLTTDNTGGRTADISGLVESTNSGSALHTFVEGGKIHGDGTFTETQSFGKDVESAHLGFHLEWNGKFPQNPSATATPDHKCSYPTTPPTTAPTTAPPAPGDAVPTLTQDCTTITIGLDNPKTGKEISLKFETSKGEVRTTVVKPGENKSEKFSAVPGFYVNVTPTGWEGHGPEQITYQKPPNCDTSGSGGGLPVTGAAAGTIAGGAGLLLLVGAVLFVMSRRRKVKFTA